MCKQSTNQILGAKLVSRAKGQTNDKIGFTFHKDVFRTAMLMFNWVCLEYYYSQLLLCCRRVRRGSHPAHRQTEAGLLIHVHFGMFLYTVYYFAILHALAGPTRTKLGAR